MVGYTVLTKMLVIFAYAVLLLPLLESAIILESPDIDDEVVSQVDLVTVIVEQEQPRLKPSKLLIRKKQVWRGIEVWDCGGTWRQKLNRSREKLVTAKLALGIENDINSTKPHFTVSTAYETAKKHIKTTEIHENRNYHPNDNYHDIVKTMIFIHEVDSKARLLYYFNFMIIETVKASSKLINAFVMVDANTCEILDSYEGVMSSNSDDLTQMKGDGGNVITGRYRYGEGKLLDKQLLATQIDDTHCQARNPYVFVNIPIQNRLLCSDVYVYREPCNPGSPNDDATETEYSQIHDALFLGTYWQQLLKSQFKDTTLRDKCGQLRICVQFGVPEFSAFVDMDNCSTFYGVAGPRLLGMVSPSIIGHELGHAIIAQTSKLEGQNQAGAISEAFCDLCGIYLKASLNNYETDWMFGSELVREQTIERAIRFMYNPPLDRRSIDHAKDFRCNKDVHHMAGVYNKAIYNLAQTDGWHLQKIFQIFFRANKFFWKKNTGFDDGLCGLLKCADDFDYSVQDVADAFAKVGVFCVCPKGWFKHCTVYCGKNNNTSCYRVVDEEASWAEAFSQCETMHAKLLSPYSVNISEWVKTNLPLNSKESYWLGATDLKTEQKWTWVYDEVPIEFDDWHRFPKIQTSKNCMVMSKVDRKWGWEDVACSQNNSFICEM